ncbi:aldehyde ferredoxin oxidoreductase C-terminal domain-containing protein, partial [Candidatus Aerophobetes bacterium]|nr:aldehyde ferredoxin oxidoreductase C-terminal domain-containing protein [Candidatus Aerophobetes bacterium]
IGDLLAEGTTRAAREIGQGAEKIVAQVRGLDIPAWDPRSFFATAINYATGTIGACHERGMCPSIELGLLFPEIGIKEAPKFFDPSGKVDICIKSQNLSALFNSLVICNYMVDGGGMSLTEILECFRTVTGWDWPINKLMEAGERVYNLQRMINIKDAKGKEEDKLPPRFFILAKTGFRKGIVPPLDEMLKEYYIRRGWDEEGRPTQETLERLGLLY